LNKFFKKQKNKAKKLKMKQISFIALAAILAVTYVAAFPLDEVISVVIIY